MGERRRGDLLAEMNTCYHVLKHTFDLTLRPRNRVMFGTSRDRPIRPRLSKFWARCATTITMMLAAYVLPRSSKDAVKQRLFGNGCVWVPTN
ncbi:hypothetical protein Pla100_38410 [Neorhodopirellula pilleata]|uniref:Uncharacterized protein n=1 Tax=Neorhodopirellula pilleata TaxID=2714738 RepID=A0A5C6A594_9BACT|nr:hypothetical protein Pla100_38410 [Neorhodopirellula pilleata]